MLIHIQCSMAVISMKMLTFHFLPPINFNTKTAPNVVKNNIRCYFSGSYNSNLWDPFYLTQKSLKPLVLSVFPASFHLLLWGKGQVSLVQFRHSVVSDSLKPHESQHARPPCPSPTPRVHSDSSPSQQWCHPAISSSVVPFPSCPQSLPASESFPMSKRFT